MTDRTHPDIELLQQVPTRLADIREFERELVAAAEPDAPEPGTQGEIDDDDVPTRHIALPRQLWAPRRPFEAEPRAEHSAERTPVPVETVLSGRTPQPSVRMWAVLGLVLCAGVAINVGFLAGLALDDEPDTNAAAAAPSADGAAAATPTALPTEAATPPGEPARVRSVAVQLPAQTVEAPMPGASDDAGDVGAEAGPLVDARRAIEAADPGAAASALERARDAGADAASLDVLRAQLRVLRGDGAAAAFELRTMTTAHPEDAAIWLAYARVLAQAERDDEAQRAFLRVLELDEHSVDAHVGIARLATRATRLAEAREHLRAAREAYERGEPDPVHEARLHVTEGIIEFELGEYGAASRHADTALALDEKSAEAHLLLARIAIQQDRDGTDELRAAVAGRAPPAEALGMLVPRAGDDACDLAERYLTIAPHGFDERTVRSAQRGCP